MPVWKERGLAALLDAGFPVLAIGGATEWEGESLRTRRWARFLRRPLTMGEVAEEVDRLFCKPGR